MRDRIPAVATFLAAFVLYANVPAILVKEHAVPVPLAGALVLLLLVPVAHARLVRREPLVFDATLGLMLAFLAVLVLSSLGAMAHRLALARILEFAIEGVLLYWLVVNAVRSLRTLRALAWGLVAAASLLGALSLYQGVSGAYSQEFGGLAHRRHHVAGEPGSRVREPLRRAEGPVDEPNRFAQIMVVLVPVAGYLYRTAGSSTVKGLSALAGGLTLVGALLTLSRGAFVALALLAVAMALVRWIRPWHVLAGTLAAAAAVPAISPMFLDRLASIADARHLLAGTSSGRDAADGAMRGRTTEMLAALHVFRDHPFLGVGPGQFKPFYSREYAQREDIRLRDITIPRRGHNLYLELASETGILGLGVFLAAIGYLMRELWRARARLLNAVGGCADLATALWLSLFAYLCTGMFLHLSYQRYFWLLVGMAAGTVRVLRGMPAPADAEDGKPCAL